MTADTSLSSLEQLRELLLQPEHARLDQQRAELDALQQAQATLPQRLPELLEAAERGAGRTALHRALAPVVAASLGDAVRRDSRSIVDALFPVIGPTIRKAIAEALRSFVADLNRALEQSFSLRGWAWRLQAWRSGVPYAQVVLKHTLRYRIDHLFLIERESGLLLHRYTASELPDLDADAIAGMLTAIGDFVRDSVQASDGPDVGLASATVGEHLVQVHEGPIAVLACFVRGVPPGALAESLREHLEHLHRSHAASAQAGADFDWTGEATRELDIDALSQFSDAPVRERPSRWPALLLLIALLLAAGWWSWQRWQSAAEAARLRAAVAATSGWQLLSLDGPGPWRLHLLRDPDAAPVDDLAGRAGILPADLQVHIQPFLALDDDLVERRLLRALQPPASAVLKVRSGVLQLSGRADADWLARIQSLLPLLPGIRTIDTTALQLGPPAVWMQEYAALRGASESRQVRFARGGLTLTDDPTPTLAAELRRALELAGMLQTPLSFEITGWSDGSGSERRNQSLRRERAQWLQQALVAAGLPPERLRVGADDATVREPAASLRWVTETVP